jgi:hypothetical protein
MLGVDLDGSPFAAEREAGRTFATEGVGLPDRSVNG